MINSQVSEAVSPEDETTFPRLMRSVLRPSLIVLFADEAIGTVVSVGDDEPMYFVGDQSSDWDAAQFQVFKGEVSLCNEADDAFLIGVDLAGAEEATGGHRVASFKEFAASNGDALSRLLTAVLGDFGGEEGEEGEEACCGQCQGAGVDAEPQGYLNGKPFFGSLGEAIAEAVKADLAGRQPVPVEGPATPPADQPAAFKFLPGNVEIAGTVLTRQCHGAARTAGWWTTKDGTPVQANPYAFSNKLALIHSEISEAMEGDRKSLKDDHLPHRDMREVELADAVIRIFDLAGAYSMDLGGALAEKMAYNSSRPDHRPENRAKANGKQY